MELSLGYSLYVADDDWTISRPRWMTSRSKQILQLFTARLLCVCFSTLCRIRSALRKQSRQLGLPVRYPSFICGCHGNNFNWFPVLLRFAEK